MTINPCRILVVEDETTIAHILSDYLHQAGYETHLIANGRAAVEWTRAFRPDLIVLDLMLPGMDGLEVCSEIRSFSDVPIIMATARVEEMDRLLGLETGADDYVCKPYAPREVVARVTAVLRRSGKAVPGGGGNSQQRLVIDDATQRIFIDGSRLDLTPTEFRLLRLLASRPGRIYSRAQILEHAYHGDRNASDRIIDTHIKNIRKKLASLTPPVDAIHSIYAIGYRFEFQEAATPPR